MNRAKLAVIAFVAIVAVSLVACDTGPDDFYHEDYVVACVDNRDFSASSPAVEVRKGGFHLEARYDAKLLLSSYEDGNIIFPFISIEWIRECTEDGIW